MDRATPTTPVQEENFVEVEQTLTQLMSRDNDKASEPTDRERKSSDAPEVSAGTPPLDTSRADDGDRSREQTTQPDARQGWLGRLWMGLATGARTLFGGRRDH